MYRQILVRLLNIRCHINPFRGSEFVTQTEIKDKASRYVFFKKIRCENANK
jgi:hypothetical protein